MFLDAEELRVANAELKQDIELLRKGMWSETSGASSNASDVTELRRQIASLTDEVRFFPHASIEALTFSHLQALVSRVFVCVVGVH